MRAQYRICETDEDLAQFTLFFIRNRHDFSVHFTLYDAIVHTLETIRASRIMLVLDPSGLTIGWGYYRYLDRNNEHHPQGEIAFIDSVIISKAYRGSRVFMEGFHRLVQVMVEENTQVKVIQFCALADHPYLNKLYSKFADHTGEREGYYGQENIYSAEINRLKNYLNQFKSFN
ncbi:hypothetical protein [Paenibacillus sp. FJAT-26967]|uniref:hypothetical protein n=1 Tax=Paenibacillus sp. FJAT-26967 TaxID=1729690 RepID=UPI0008395553|nr:hypothetical protein [Paenibacillus sp. FJAT-26967]